MKKSEVNGYSMFLAVLHFYEKYETILTADSVIKRLFEEFFGHLITLRNAIQIQKGHTSEATKQKHIEEDEMVQATLRYANKGFVYASEKKLPGLIEKFTTSSWALQRLSDVKLHTACLSIYEALLSIAPEAIAEYGATASDLEVLKKEIDDFYGFISQPRSDIITRSQATAQIKEMVKMIKMLLKNRLDKMIDSLPPSQNTLKNEYKAARMIINISGKKSDDDTSPDDNPDS